MERKFIYFYALGVKILFHQNSWLGLENSLVTNSKYIQKPREYGYTEYTIVT